MSTTYQAGGAEFQYPGAGDEEPTRGAKVNLLTKGGISTTGPWDPSYCIGWAPLNARNSEKEARLGPNHARKSNI